MFYGGPLGTALANSAKHSHCNPNVSEFCARTYLLDLLGDDAEQLWLRGVGIHAFDIWPRTLDYSTIKYWTINYKPSIYYRTTDYYAIRLSINQRLADY